MKGSPFKLDFYFDFISPFGYLASLKVEEVAARHGWDSEWHSMLVGVSVLKVMGMKPLPSIPLKGEYLQRELRRYCRRHAIVLGRNPTEPPLNPLPAGRAYHWVKAHHPGLAKLFAAGVLAAYWVKNKDIADFTILKDCMAEVGGDSKALMAALTSSECNELLREAVAVSIERGVFGSPFFIAEGEPFFGLDKLGLLEDWLSSGGW